MNEGKSQRIRNYGIIHFAQSTVVEQCEPEDNVVLCCIMGPGVKLLHRFALPQPEANYQLREMLNKMVNVAFYGAKVYQWRWIAIHGVTTKVVLINFEGVVSCLV